MSDKERSGIQGITTIFFLIAFHFLSNAQFVELSFEKGIDHRNASNILFGGGVAFLDIDNDNLLDLFFTGGIGTDKLYRNTGSAFERIITYIYPEDFDFLDYSTQGVAAGDLNNDGYDDLFVTTEGGYTNLLMINNGDYKFDIIPADSSGIVGSRWSISAAMGDVNNDGLLDIFVGNYIEEINSYIDTLTGLTVFDHTGFQNQLFINQGDLTFRDATDQYGLLKKGTTLAAAFTNYDQDEDMDLYVVNDFGHFIIPNELYSNQIEDAIYEDVSVSSGADIGLYGMGVAIGDYDNDLDFDYYITNIGRNSLLRNNSDGTFDDIANAANVQDSSITDTLAKVGWGTGFFDFDNDGLLDLYISNGHIPAAYEISNPIHNPNSLYRNLGDGSFEEVSDEMNVDLTAVCRGSAAGDLDSDGDLDLIFIPVNTFGGFGDTSLREKAAVYYNQIPNENHWIAFKTVGTNSNRNGYGAHIYIYDNEGNVQLREVDGGSSHASSNSPHVNFGIGTANWVDSAVIHWPSGHIQRVISPYINLLNVIVEGGDTVVQEPVISNVEELDVMVSELYPNPASSYIKVVLSHGFNPKADLSWQLFSMDGKIIRSSFIESDIFEINVSRLPAGQYYITFNSGDQRISHHKIIKE